MKHVEVSLERCLEMRYKGVVQRFLCGRALVRDLGRTGANFAMLSGIQMNERLF